MNTDSIYILDGKRTPFGSFGKSLKDVHTENLGIIPSKYIINSLKLPREHIGHCVFGNVIPSETSFSYLARHIALKANLPETTPCLLVNRLCGSGMEAIIQSIKMILLSESSLVLCGGIESMSRAFFFTKDARWGLKYGSSELKDTIECSLNDEFIHLIMGQTAENLARKYHISREEQDEYAILSQTRAENAPQKLQEEIVPVETKSGTVSKDEHIRGKKVAAKLKELNPIFDSNGTVTAGNSSGINDGGVSLILSSKSYAEKHSHKPLVKILSYANTACSPNVMGIGPVNAIKSAIENANLNIKDIGLFEVNEAFAAQLLAVKKELNLNIEHLNVNGGAISIGHPLAASGARITLSLAYEMRRRNIKYGVASLCIGGGQGIALVLENPFT